MTVPWYSTYPIMWDVHLCSLRANGDRVRTAWFALSWLPEVVAAGGNTLLEFFLVDTGSDRTIFSASPPGQTGASHNAHPEFVRSRRGRFRSRRAG